MKNVILKAQPIIVRTVSLMHRVFFPKNDWFPQTRSRRNEICGLPNYLDCTKTTYSPNRQHYPQAHEYWRRIVAFHQQNTLGQDLPQPKSKKPV